MKRRLRKKLRVKEFEIQEWFVGFHFTHELNEQEIDKFWDEICDFVDSHKHLYFGGGTNCRIGDFMFFGDTEPKYQVTQELAIEIFKWVSDHDLVKSSEMHNVTNFSDDDLNDLFKRYDHFMNYEEQVLDNFKNAVDDDIMNQLAEDIYGEK